MVRALSFPVPLMPTMPPTFRARSQPTRLEQRRRYDEARRRDKPWRAWYQTPEWRAIRKRQLEMEPNCRAHRKAGELVKATVCDHIEPHRGDKVRFFAGPFQSLCKPCHDSAKQREERAARSARLA